MSLKKLVNSEARNHDEKLDENRLKLSSLVAFLMGFSQAVLAYIMSSYFKLATGTENVGIFYAVAYLIFLVISKELTVQFWNRIIILRNNCSFTGE